jgi:hypothetical protein
MAWERQALPEVLEAATGMARWSARQGLAEPALVTAFFVLNHPVATEQTKEAVRRLRPALEAQLAPEQVEVAKGSAEELSLEALVTSFLGRLPV